MFASKDIFLTPPSTGGYTIARSVRLRSSATAYFNRTFTTPTDNKKWTMSMWLKRGSLGGSINIFGSVLTGGYFEFRFNTSDQIYIQNRVSSTNLLVANTTAVYRDPSAWYHIVFAFDSANATAANRNLLYVNGVNVALSANSGSGDACAFNSSGNTQYIGNSDTYTTFDGYMAEINFIDGQALTPSSFGTTNAITGVWQPAKYTGTYGTNGFYLNFSDNSSNTATTIGKDYSGNGNNWTPNNISVTAGVTYDSMVDSPTVGATSSNYCVWSPIDKGSVTVTNGNLSAVATADVAALRGTMGLPQSGKWYWETTLSAQGYGTGLGIADNACPISNFNAGSTQSRTFQWGSFSGGVTLYGTNQSVLSGTSWAGASQVAANDVVMIAVDMDNGSMWVGKNGTWFNSSGTANPATNTDPRWTGLTGTTWFPVYASYGTSSPPTANANFGQQGFKYTPPTGFVALNTYNLPASTITNGAAYMAATTYTGTGVTGRAVSNAVNGISMQPDLVWVKSRSSATYNELYDSVRGVSLRLFSNDTAAEASYAPYGVTAFSSGGFTVSDITSSGYGVNENGVSYVGWQWKAGTTSASNTNGSITSTVSANTTAGFSVVTYTLNNSTFTVGHGLGVAPNMIIVKDRDTTNNWDIYHSSIGAGSRLTFTTSTPDVSSQVWNNTAPTSTVFSGNSAWWTNPSTSKMVAYCFAAVAGYSAFGSYTGNGSADGPFVFTNFQPKFVMIKSSTRIEDWHIMDTSRSPYNQVSAELYPNTSGAESTLYNQIDILSNGFKMRSTNSGTNNSGDTYVYACFASNPFKQSLAR